MSDNKWEKKVKKQKKKEWSIIGLLLLIIGIGIGSELVSIYCKSIYYVHNYDAVSLVAIQVQATVFSLTIALIALLSGRITDEFLGVKYNDFILNRKPYFLTQIKIIGLLLTLLVVNLFLHMFGFYNIVIAIFVVTVFLVLYSARMIYGAFSGNEQIEKEIHAYVDYVLLSENNKIDVFNDFCAQWSRENTLQEAGEYETYLEVFNRGFSVLVKEDVTRSILLDRCIELSRLLLKKTDTNKKGIRFVKECYDNAWTFIRNEGLESSIVLSRQVVPFCLFENIYYELCEAIMDMKVKDVEKSFRWNDLTDIILQVDTFLGYDTKNPNINSEIECIKEFGGFMGYYISPKCENDNPVNRSDEFWGSTLSQTYTYYLFPDNLKKEAAMVIAERNFQFIVSQMRVDNAELVKEYVYMRGLQHFQLDQSFVLMILKFHSYVYYLSEFEIIDYIGQELKNRAKAFLEDAQIVKIFNSFLLSVSERDINIFDYGHSDLDIFNDKLISKLSKELRPFESFPPNGTAKFLIMEQAVQQFILFTVVFISNHYHALKLLKTIITEEHATSLYIKYIKDYNQTKEFKRFLKIIGVADYRIEDQASAAYTSLVNCIKEQYKYHSIHEAEEAEKVLDIELEENKDQLAGKIKEYFEEEFKGILGNSRGKIYKASLLTVSTFSDEKIDTLMNGNYDLLFNQFVYLLARKLYQEGKLKVISKKEFCTDDELLDYIKSHKDSAIIGSEFILMPNDYRRWDEFKEAILVEEHYTTGGRGLVLFISKDALKISITKIRIGAHIPTIYETSAIFNKETDTYSYEISSDMAVDFTKEEFLKYLSHRKRIVNIVVHFSIDAKDGVIGDVIQEVAN